MIKYAFTFKMIAETKIDESDNEFVPLTNSKLDFGRKT